MNITSKTEFFQDIDELEMTLDVAWKIRSHMNRLVNREGKVRYANNLELLDEMIGSYNEQLHPAMAV